MLTKLSPITHYELLKIFHSGCKPKNSFKIGLESERVGVNSKNHFAAKYSGKNGIKEVLNAFKIKYKWQEIKQDGLLIGLRKGDDTITLEPGSQFELSLSPKSLIRDIELELVKFNSVTSEIAQNHHITWLGYGIQPLSTNKTIEILPKSRYDLMSKYLPTVGENALVMMKESCGTQVAYDYDSEEDAIRKLRLTLALSAIMSGVFANSPIRGGKDSGYKSYRAFAWLNTDNSRCGLISEKLFDKSYEFTFNDYKETLLDVPLIFIARGDKIIAVNGKINFREYLESGYEGIDANIEDWNLHMSLYFPDVRLKNFLEIRNFDCQKQELTLALPAFWKGILYNENALTEAENIAELFNWSDLNELRTMSAKHGIDINHKGHDIADIVNELVQVSYQSLKSMCKGEEKYLKPLIELLKSKKCPADIILEKWHGEWNKDLSKLIGYTKISSNN